MLEVNNTLANVKKALLVISVKTTLMIAKELSVKTVVPAEMELLHLLVNVELVSMENSARITLMIAKL